MGVWKVAEERCAEMGQIMAGYRGVSHCYQRPDLRGLALPPLLDDARARQGGVRGGAGGISRETGLDDYAVLYSTREYKKTRLKYFTPEAEAWEAAHEPLLTT